MAASINVQKKSQETANRAWELYIAGLTQWDIANELGITQARVSQMIKSVAKAHPINKLSMEERMALSEERWNLSEREMREEIQEQRRSGRVVREVIRLPNGHEQVKVTKTEGVDPALLRALSTHHDRRARQLNNQLSPDAGVQAVQVNVVRDFLQQGDTSGKLSPEQWNQQTLDV
ncbi:TrfB-related DNA-binding protein [Synechococcus sp. CC9616]|uniref:TrfB-related DNA-binding protein n=1 Tax=Synechococcus sp. CC9616 TaxID=110663 RepID=UPI00048E1A0A|nr:TrfB-related DNA-binding protein [Synechococcus sp. CC9616]